MIFWLDHKIFGNGYGLATPYFDGRFYWLSGEIYTFSGGLGAQLTSFQWRHPKPGERRCLAGRQFVPFQSNRYVWWLFRRSLFAIPLPVCRVCVSWAAVNLPENLDKANEFIRHLEKDIGRHV